MKILKPQTVVFGGDSWEIKRERLDALWTALRDEKGREVHGWALLTEIPESMLGRVLTSEWSRHEISAKAFGVEMIATRDGKSFGASRRTIHFATRDEALAYARKSLIQQGKRYASKYEAMP